MADEVNGRTHEPNLRELTGDLDKLERLFDSKLSALRELVNERDKQYQEKFNSQGVTFASGLVAAEKQTAAAFLASEKANAKAEEAQRDYNTAHNDLSKKMDDQYKSMVPASEARLKWTAQEKEDAEMRKDLNSIRETFPKDINNLRTELMKEIQGLRESRSEQGGGQRVIESTRTQSDWRISVAISLAAILIAIILALIFRKP